MFNKSLVSLLAAGACAAAFFVSNTAEAQQGKGEGPGAPQAEPKGPAEPNLGNAEIHTLKVQGNVYMLYGPNTNMALQIGPSGVLVVDAMYAQLSARVLTEIRKLSDKPLRYILNTSADLHHVGGNYTLNRAGQPIVGGNLGQAAFDRGATIVAHENVLNRMSAPSGQVPPFPETQAYVRKVISLYFQYKTQAQVAQGDSR